MQLARYFNGSTRTVTWLDRVLVLCVVLLLSLQLLSSGRHKDDHVGQSDNCPSCAFAHHLPHGLPDVAPRLVPVSVAHSYQIARLVIVQAPAPFSFLVPHSHGPPQA